MKTKDLVLDERCEREVVKEIGEVLPDAGVTVFAEALIVEAVDLRDLTRLVVSTEDGDALGITDFEGDKEGDCLDGEVPTVDVITYSAGSATMRFENPAPLRTHEEVVGVGVRSANLEQLHEIVKLAVYISTNSDRTFLVIGFSDCQDKEKVACLTTGCTLDSSCSTSRA